MRVPGKGYGVGWDDQSLSVLAEEEEEGGGGLHEVYGTAPVEKPLMNGLPHDWCPCWWSACRSLKCHWLINGAQERDACQPRINISPWRRPLHPPILPSDKNLLRFFPLFPPWEYCGSIIRWREKKKKRKRRRITSQSLISAVYGVWKHLLRLPFSYIIGISFHTKSPSNFWSVVGRAAFSSSQAL